MKITYANNKVEMQCTSMKDATRLFGGDSNLAISLLARINALESADVIRDIIIMPTFHFHNLHGKLEGFLRLMLKPERISGELFYSLWMRMSDHLSLAISM